MRGGEPNLFAGAQVGAGDEGCLLKLHTPAVQVASTERRCRLDRSIRA